MTARLLMTQAEFARHRGVGKSAVSNWKRDGLVVFAEAPDGRPRVDVARTDAKLNARLDPMRGRPSGGGAEPGLPLEAPAQPLAAPSGEPVESLQSVRIEVLKEQRVGQAMKNARDAKELAPVVELEQRASEMGRAARERVHAMFRGLAERLAAEKDVRQIMAIGEEAIDRVFAELADEADAGEFGEPEGVDIDADELLAIEAAEAAAEDELAV